MASVSCESVSFVSSWFMSVAMDIVEMSDSSGLIDFVVSRFSSACLHVLMLV